MFSLEHLPVPFLLRAICWAPPLYHGKVTARWREHFLLDGLLLWFEVMLYHHSLMAMRRHVLLLQWVR
jgi:hypothetical protein